MRLRTYYASDRGLLDLLNIRAEVSALGQAHAWLSVMEAIPEDARIDRVYYDHARRSLCLQVEHDSFDDVLPGCELPRFPTGVTLDMHVIVDNKIHLGAAADSDSPVCGAIYTREELVAFRDRLNEQIYDLDHAPQM